IEVVEGSAALGGDVVQQKVRSSPLSLIALMIILPAAAFLLFWDDQLSPTDPVKPNPPDLWKPPSAQCPQADRGQALSYARERMAIADAKRERRPFHVQDGVSAVPIYEMAAACFRAGGDGANANLADESAEYLRREMTDDFRLRRVKLDH